VYVCGGGAGGVVVCRCVSWGETGSRLDTWVSGQDERRSEPGKKHIYVVVTMGGNA